MSETDTAERVNGEVLPPQRERDGKGRYLSGHAGQFQPGNPGRPRGVRARLGEDFLADLHEAWKTHRKAVIEKVVRKKPDVFLRVIAQVIPKELILHTSPLDEMDREDLRNLATTIERALQAVANDPEAAARLASSLPGNVQ